MSAPAPAHCAQFACNCATLFCQFRRFSFQLVFFGKSEQPATVKCTQKNGNNHFRFQTILALNCLHIEISSHNKAITLIFSHFSYMYISRRMRSLIKIVLVPRCRFCNQSQQPRINVLNARGKKISFTSVKHKCWKYSQRTMVVVATAAMVKKIGVFLAQ